MPGSLLVVDDDPRMSRALARLLVREGYEVRTAHSGDQCLALANSGPTDLIILDWVLPDRDGLDVLKQLRARGVTCPVVVLTGQPDSANPVIALDAGADDYLVKLGNTEELLARVRALLRRSQAPQA
jgi:DNA-binding response OmpR family regulator